MRSLSSRTLLTLFGPIILYISQATAQVVTEFPYRINAGANPSQMSAVVDSDGRTWGTDEYFTTGYFDSRNRCGSSIGPGPECRIRFFNTQRNPAPYGYGIPVPNGQYTVGVVFMETFYTTPGERIMDVVIEGDTVFAGLDIVQETGWKNTRFSFNSTVTVTDGVLDVHVVGVYRNPLIAGVEVFGPPPAPVAPTTSPAPTFAPTSLQPTPEPEFEGVFINCGGPDFTDGFGRLWKADYGYTGGSVYSIGNAIENTNDDFLYQSERYGTPTYAISLPDGNYQVVLHAAELYWTATSKRIFNVNVEGTTRDNIDLVALAGGARVAFTMEFPVVVSDGELNIAFTKVLDWAKLSAIEVVLVGPHLAHSVPNGPYIAVDVDQTGSAVIDVDGQSSHTHGTGLFLNSWVWSEGTSVLASSAVASLQLPVGEHIVALTVTDNDGNESIETAEMTVFAFGYPLVTALLPNEGSIAGGDIITISGSGFTYSASQTIVHFGVQSYTGNEITVVNDSTITMIVPPTTLGIPVDVAVETPLGTSIAQTYTYIASMPINFASGSLVAIDLPATAEFGPNGDLYVGTTDGRLARFTLNDDHTAVLGSVSVSVAPGRYVMGLAFDPMDPNIENPAVYISTNEFFHGESSSFTGKAINGDIRRVTGANLDIQETIISNLPVSDHDHGVNGIEFGDNGELYIMIGGNTNGGVPGELSGSQIQEEGYFSGATLVADLNDPNFDGQITYDSSGVPTLGKGIEIFAYGLRNPFAMVLHSNGRIYATDNGPNKQYGDMKTGCGAGQQVPDKFEKDKLNLLERGKYYGHPNSIRASVENDSRQCVWRSAYEAGDSDYEAPLMTLASSTDGIIEWSTNHFLGQMRYNLILSKYTGAIYRVILDTDGTSVIPESENAIRLFNLQGKSVGWAGLDVAQSPSGTLAEVRYEDNVIYFHKPVETPSSDLFVHGVYPRRGSFQGGFTLQVYGINFNGGTPTVTVGGNNCPVTSATASLIECTLPAGSGQVDVVVSAFSQSSTFEKGFKYITGTPGPAPSPTPPTGPTSAPITPSPVTSSPTASPGGQWIETEASAPIQKRHEACFVMAGTRAFLIGGRGNKRTDIYDPVTRSWAIGAAPPGGDIHHIQCVAVDDKIYLAAAYTGAYPNEVTVPNMLVYDTTNDTWSTKDALPVNRRRGSAAAIVVGRRIYVSHGSVGGHEQAGQDNVQATGMLDYYDIDLDVWVTGLPDAPHPRDHCGGAYIQAQNKICIAGGRDGGIPNWPVVPETDCFDLTTETWTTEANIPQPRAGSSYGSTCDGKLMIAGGEGSGQAYDNVDVFDGTSWTPIDSLVKQRHGSGLAFNCPCDQIYIASGSGNAGGTPELFSVETYFPSGTDTVCTL